MEKRVKGYATANRRKILDYLKSSDNRMVTVMDIDRYLKENNSEVNLTTIYRYMDRLAGEGTVIKYAAERGGQAAYQYAGTERRCGDHLHLKCVSCGSIFHLDCAFMGEISRHILEDHGFMLQCKSSILYGSCQRCREKENGSAQELRGEKESGFVPDGTRKQNTEVRVKNE